jgi:pSer/pThr/pTyr-binding forkhead associated (FHA) protein
MSAETKTVRIGRGQGCDLILSHASISRRHAELTIHGDGSVDIRDLDSTGGTYVLREGKEVPVVRATLRPNDALRLGDYEISLADLLALIPGAPAVPAPSAGAVYRPPAAAASPTPRSDTAPASEERPKTRMVRCSCGHIKERDKPCPSCGS